MVSLVDTSHMPSPRSRPLAGPPQVATYRLQLHAGFGFADAAARVPYLRRLGISHLYLSPVLTARAGSTHGYDVVDPSHANPALGGDAGFDALAETVRAHGMGLVLDVVPNHMGTGDANPYWDDVLAFGRESPYARWFDVAWEHLARIGRRQLVLPVLGDTLEAVLARGELSLAAEPRGVRVRYYEHSLPLDPRTVHRLFAFHHEYAFSDARHADGAEVLLLRDALAPEGGASLARGDAERAVRALGERAARVPAIGAYVEWALRRFCEGDDGRYRLTALLDLQHWRLTHWRRAWRELNYRRFFDISDLVALRAEDPRVFDATHRWTLERVARGQVHAVRVDHVDGLRDPLAYLRRLRAALDARAPDGAHVPVYVEKILTAGERLPAEWPVDGTTGYEALNDLEAPLVDAAGFATIEAAYRRTIRLKPAAPGFAEVAVRGKELVLRTAFRPEIRRAVRALVRVARAERAGFPPPVLAEAVLRLAAALPVYRSYVTADEAGGVHASAEDRAVLDRALQGALPRTAGDERAAAALRFVVAVLTGELPGADAPPAARQAAAEFALRFQQTSGPATAKGVEDTAIYRWTPLASLNEVGGEPDRDLRTSVAALHAANAERAAHWPRALVTVTTHDTKRSADARAGSMRSPRTPSGGRGACAPGAAGTRRSVRAWRARAGSRARPTRTWRGCSTSRSPASGRRGSPSPTPPRATRSPRGSPPMRRRRRARPRRTPRGWTPSPSSSRRWRRSSPPSRAATRVRRSAPSWRRCSRSSSRRRAASRSCVPCSSCWGPAHPTSTRATSTACSPSSTPTTAGRWTSTCAPPPSSKPGGTRPTRRSSAWCAPASRCARRTRRRSPPPATRRSSPRAPEPAP
jgi:(1->4)-alpha-D-glucan 1-alpha-D-glucosylmutase